MANESNPQNEAQRILEKIRKIGPDVSIMHVSFGKPLSGFEINSPELQDQKAIERLIKDLRNHRVQVTFNMPGNNRRAFITPGIVSDTEYSNQVFHAISELIMPKGAARVKEAPTGRGKRLIWRMRKFLRKKGKPNE
ncbi:MAG: hypothetical protein ABH863_06270 [Candidatus Micrarchaeota archaeon]